VRVSPLNVKWRDSHSIPITPRTCGMFIKSSVADPYHFDADPDPDPDPRECGPKEGFHNITCIVICFT